MKKTPTIEDKKKEIQNLAKNIIREQEHWKELRDNGCSDPFWSDGCNMNLTRNHILYNKSAIAKICSETGIEFPEEYFIPTPPEVDGNYMANLKQKERVERLRHGGVILTKKCPVYNSEQLSLF